MADVTFPTYALSTEGTNAIVAVTNPRYATTAQGAKADTAVQPEDLAPVATSGVYDDLTGLPTLGTAAAEDVEAFATAAQGALADGAVQATGDVIKLRAPLTQLEYDNLPGGPQADTLYIIVNN